MSSRRLLAVLTLLASVLTGLVVAGPASAAPTAPPVVSGTPVYAGTLRAQPGTWTPAPPGYAYQWLRAGAPIAGATAATYTPGLDDLGKPLAVQVSATDGSGSAVSAATAPVAKATMTASRQRVLGEARFTHSLKARPGRFSAPDATVSYAWPDGSTGRGYRIRPDDVGRRVVLTITATAPGYAPLEVVAKSPVVRYRVDVRRRVTYHVETRGHVTASVKEFEQLAQETYDDPRGWRSSGIRFRPVASGGSFTLVLAEASYLPRFSSQCSSMWSCRVGRFVVINQDRWLHASPSWNAAGGTLRDYRNMVVDHETGHWLGLHHVGCPGPGQPAPVMMQQSKDLQGCTFNPWPTPHEIAGRTPRA